MTRLEDGRRSVADVRRDAEDRLTALLRWLAERLPRRHRQIMQQFARLLSFWRFKARPSPMWHHWVEHQPARVCRRATMVREFVWPVDRKAETRHQAEAVRDAPVKGIGGAPGCCRRIRTDLQCITDDLNVAAFFLVVCRVRCLG